MYKDYYSRYDDYDYKYANLLGTEWQDESERGMTIQEYADKHCISYEAVRRQVNRYKYELAPHTIIRNRTKYFDDTAIAFLEKHRKPTAQPEDTKAIRKQVSELRNELEENKSALFNFETLASLEQELGAMKNQIATLEIQLKEARELCQQKQAAYDKLLEKYHRETTSLQTRLECHDSQKEFLENLASLLNGELARKTNFDL